MRKPTLLVLAALAALPAFAQDDDDDKAPSQPVENLYFNTDEYIAIPKFTFSYGYRALTGSKATFRGTSKVYNKSVTAPEVLGNTTGAKPSEHLVYDDGIVGVDTRTDAGGRPLPSDGTTNNWIYEHASQVSAGGFIDFHSYSAQVLDEGNPKESMGNTYGLEVTVARDLPKLAPRILWNIGGGLSLNDIRQQSTIVENARITTITDKYWLGGAAAPEPGVSSPSTVTINVVQADGTVTSYTTNVNNTAFLTQLPVVNGVPVLSDGTVTNSYKIKGSYFTLRAGPTFIIPFTAKLRVSFGFGAALVYAGTQYTITSEFIPSEEEKKTPITKTDTDYEKKALPGYYLDANIEYWITERAGLYAGAIFQSTGTYDQRVNPDEEADYSSRVDLTTQSGFRLGMNYRF